MGFKKQVRSNNGISYRSEGGSGRIIGYASVFNQRSKLIAENGKVFYEVIARGAFDEILTQDINVIANVQHDNDRMLARSKSGTLSLRVDEIGLEYNILVPDTQLGKDTAEMVERGDYFESSFAYGARSADVSWDMAEDGFPIRTVHKVSALFDVAIVRDGAFANTEVAVRELKEQYPDYLRETKEDSEEGNVIPPTEKDSPPTEPSSPETESQLESLTNENRELKKKVQDLELENESVKRNLRLKELQENEH